VRPGRPKYRKGGNGLDCDVVCARGRSRIAVPFAMSNNARKTLEDTSDSADQADNEKFSFSVCTVSIEYFQWQTGGCISCAQVDAPSLVIKCGLGDRSGGGARIFVCLYTQGIIIRPALSSAHVRAVANEPNTVLSRHVSLEESSNLR
jgi:hypothetical protein